MRPEIAHRRIEAFGKRFGEAHLYLAYHAAFPLALTPDLLYRLWANFQRDIYGEVLNLPWIAVADLLLSSLCDEVGHELYEMEKEVRNALLSELKANPRFGTERINELSDFLLAYVRQQLDSPDIDTRDFAQAQRWTALAYSRPSEAAREIATALTRMKLEDRAEWVRMASLVETFAEPLAEFEPLLIYTRGMADFIRGNQESTANQFSKVRVQQHEVKVAGIRLNLLETIEKNPQFIQNEKAIYEAQSYNSLSGKSSQAARIIYVENDADTLFLVQTILEGEGYRVEVENSSSLALPKIESSPPDLIMMEISMSGIDGYELTRRIRQNKQLPFIPILLITKHDEPSAVKGLDMGADDFIRKPVQFDEFLGRVRSLLRLKHSIDERDQIVRQFNRILQEQQILEIGDEDVVSNEEQITQARRTFRKEVLESPMPVLVHFGASWSGLCRIIMPLLKEFQLQWGEQVKLVYVNADKNLKLATTYRIKSLPTLILFKNGKVVHRLDSFQGKDEVRIALEAIIESNRDRHSNSA
jgi:DNA-binding response OmpR family regulator